MVLRTPTMLELFEGLPAVHVAAWEDLTPRLLKSDGTVASAMARQGLFSWARLTVGYWRQRLAEDVPEPRPCADAPAWQKHGEPAKGSKGCSWVAAWPERCQARGTGGALAAPACPGTCSPACSGRTWEVVKAWAD